MVVGMVISVDMGSPGTRGLCMTSSWPGEGDEFEGRYP